MAQPLLKQLMTQTFDDSPMGYPGAEDNGSMAAWYIFNSLGFYPVTPGTGEYVIGMPLIDKAVLLLSNGKELKQRLIGRSNNLSIKSNGWTKNIRNYILPIKIC